MSQKDELIQQEQSALAILDEAASLAPSTRAGHVLAQNAVILLRSALIELESFRVQREKMPAVTSENGQELQNEPEVIGE